jgi:hypothetical protein
MDVPQLEELQMLRRAVKLLMLRAIIGDAEEAVLNGDFAEHKLGQQNPENIATDWPDQATIESVWNELRTKLDFLETQIML